MVVVVFTGILCIWMKLKNDNNDNNRASEREFMKKMFIFAQNTLTVCCGKVSFFLAEKFIEFSHFWIERRKKFKRCQLSFRFTAIQFSTFFLFLLLSNNDDYCFLAFGQSFIIINFFSFLWFWLFWIWTERKKWKRINQLIGREIYTRIDRFAFNFKWRKRTDRSTDQSNKIMID